MFSGDKKWEPWLELGKIDGFSQTRSWKCWKKRSLSVTLVKSELAAKFCLGKLFLKRYSSRYRKMYKDYQHSRDFSCDVYVWIIWWKCQILPAQIVSKYFMIHRDVTSVY